MEKFDGEGQKENLEVTESQPTVEKTGAESLSYLELRDEIKKDKGVIPNYDERAKEISKQQLTVKDYSDLKDIIKLTGLKLPLLFKVEDVKYKKYMLQDFAVLLRKIVDQKVKISDYQDFLGFKNPVMYTSGLTVQAVRFLGFTTIFDRFYTPGYSQVVNYFQNRGEGISVLGQTIPNSSINHNLVNIICRYCAGKFDNESIGKAVNAMCKKIEELSKLSYDQIFFYTASKYEEFFQKDHYIRDDLYDNNDRMLIDYTDQDGQQVAGRMLSDIQSYIKSNPGKRILVYTSTHGIQTGEGVTSVFGSSNDVVFDNDRYAEISDLVLKNGGSVYHDRCFGQKVAKGGVVGTNTGDYTGLYYRDITIQYAQDNKAKLPKGTLFMNLKLNELFNDPGKVLNIPELNP